MIPGRYRQSTVIFVQWSTGTCWITFSDGLNTGSYPPVTGTDNATYNVVQIQVNAQSWQLYQQMNLFQTVITDPRVIKPGLTLSNRDITGDGAAKFYGTAEKAESAHCRNNVNVSAGNFLRSDIVSTTLNGLNVQNNAGINYGNPSEMNIGIEGNAGIIQHSSSRIQY